MTPETVIEIGHYAMRTTVFVAGPMLVAGMIVGEYIADFCDSDEGQLQASSSLPRRALQDQADALDALASTDGIRFDDTGALFLTSGGDDLLEDAQRSPGRSISPLGQRPSGRGSFSSASARPGGTATTGSIRSWAL